MADGEFSTTMPFVGNGCTAKINIRFRNSCWYEYSGDRDDLKSIGVLSEGMLPAGRKRLNFHFSNEPLGAKDWRVEKKKNNQAAVTRWTGKNFTENEYPFASATDEPTSIPNGVARIRSPLDLRTYELMSLIQIMQHEKFGEIALSNYPNLEPIETLKRLLDDYEDWIRERMAEASSDVRRVDRLIRIWRMMRQERRERERQS